MPGARAASPRLVDWAERGLVPDPLIRLGIRRMLRERLRQQAAGGREAQARRRAAFLEQIRRAPVALSPADPNRQHYEVPAAFFRHVLGARMKYSCAHFAPGVEGLDAAEASMLALTCQRAGIQDGMQVLDLGCG